MSETKELKLYVLAGICFKRGGVIENKPFIITADGNVGLTKQVAWEMAKEFPAADGYYGHNATSPTEVPHKLIEDVYLQRFENGTAEVEIAASL